ncbi:MAG: polysaccharide deacetylase family protein [Oscillospiraceae bacterium]|nr:polysaccharide deacetylase family protein [Oscillospiraceae bacterium]
MKKIIALMVIFIITMSTVTANAAANVAALMYHRVTRDESRVDEYTISPDMLDSDIAYFISNGYITMTASELAAADMSEIDGRNILLLTFDDGYSNFYTEVFPILQKYNAKATMYIVGSYINRYGYLIADQVHEMAHSGLVEIGNHTNAIHHTPRALLENIYNTPNSFFEIILDIKNNGETLKNITSIDVTSLSWPYGYYTTELDREVKAQTGYGITFSTEYGVNIFTGDTSLPLKRMNRDCYASTQEVFERANNLFY